MQKEWIDHDCPICKALEPEAMEKLTEELNACEEDIDLDSNHVVDLLESGQIDAAETAARELMKKYPDAIDGLDRLAGVFEAKGDLTRAIQHYKSAIAFTHVFAGFDEESRDYYKEKIRELQGLLP